MARWIGAASEPMHKLFQTIMENKFEPKSKARKSLSCHNPITLSESLSSICDVSYSLIK